MNVKAIWREFLSIILLVAVSWFLLAGAGIFTMWFWLMVFT